MEDKNTVRLLTSTQLTKDSRPPEAPMKLSHLGPSPGAPAKKTTTMLRILASPVFHEAILMVSQQTSYFF